MERNTQREPRLILIFQDIEADVYWCTCALVRAIQAEHFVVEKYGKIDVEHMMRKLKSLVQMIDRTCSRCLLTNSSIPLTTVNALSAPLYDHLQRMDIDFMHFAFRWLICLLIRELPMGAITRLWDAYIAQGQGFAPFHPYGMLLRHPDMRRICSYPSSTQYVSAFPLPLADASHEDGHLRGDVDVPSGTANGQLERASSSTYA